MIKSQLGLLLSITASFTVFGVRTREKKRKKPFLANWSMARNLESPVQTQMAVSALNIARSSEHQQKPNSDGKAFGRRRVFVQTETGCVLGLELDNNDNAHTVKRKLQVALNVPTEQSSLTFGDLVLKNDLSAIRNDSALLLTRSSLHRSSSTPCLSPRGKDLQQRDSSGPIEIVGCSSVSSVAKQLVKDVAKAIKAGVDPVTVHNGLGGAYYFRNKRGENIAIVKPTDEEPYAPNNPKGFVGKALGQPGLKRSVRVGETGYREVAAYLLDYEHFANVPPTVLVKITHSAFNVNEDTKENGSLRAYGRTRDAVSKIASFQKFIHHDFDASDHGTSSFPVAAVHRIGILDVRIFNTDRHAGNLLVRKHDRGSGNFGSQAELIPIDHGLCLPECLEDPYFEWIHWPQASIPFSEDELEYIHNLDPSRDCDMLRRELPMIREACLRVLILSTIFLKEAAAFGLCLAEIGEMMSREFTGGEEEPSELELVCIEARRLVLEREAFSPVSQFVDEDIIQFDIDSEDVDPLPRTPRLKGGNFRNPFSRLESLEEEDDDCQECCAEEITYLPPVRQHLPSLSTSMKGVSLNKMSNVPLSVPKDCSTNVRTIVPGSVGWLQGGSRRSANEQVPVSASFVKLADMGDAEWASFLVNFQELLPGALRNRRCSTTDPRQRQRLGTSCQF